MSTHVAAREEMWDEAVDAAPWEGTRARQRQALGPWLTGLSQRTGLYAGRLRGLQVPADPSEQWLADLPFTTKADLRHAQEQASDDRPLGDLQGVRTEDLVQVIASSGTTGTPMFFGLTGDDLAAWRNTIANVYWTAGVRRSSTVALTTGMTMVAGGLPYADGIRETGATLAWVGGQTPGRMVTIVDALKVDVLVGTASFSTFFSRQVEASLGRPASELGIQTIIGGGEPGLGTPEIRERVRETWGAQRISEIMGIGDVLSGMWSECAQGEGMHFVAAPHVLVELIDPETGALVPWEPGATGEAVYTTIGRQASPVLRYRSRDHMLVTGVECSCGRMSPTVRCVGRTDDMLIYKAMNVFPSAIRDVLLNRFPDRLTGSMRIRKERTDQVRFDDPIPLELEFADAGATHVAALVADMEEHIRQELRVRVAIEALTPGTIVLGNYKNTMTYVKND